MNERERKRLLIKAKTYKILAGFFAVVGLGIFLTTYINNIDGHVLEALKEPQTIILTLIPFIPALFLSWKYKKIIDECSKNNKE